MKEFRLLLAPLFWSLRNDIKRTSRLFYRKFFAFLILGPLSVYLATTLLSEGMMKLKDLPSDIFIVLTIKAYSLIFILLFFMLILSGFIISMTLFFRSPELELLLVSPVKRSSLFLAKLTETNIRASWMICLFGLSLIIAAGSIHETTPLFYLYAIVLLIVFSIIPVNLGVSISFVITNFFDIRKLRRFLISGGAILFAALVVFFRIFKPERFVNPEFFANLTLFVSELRTPAFILLPSRWFGEAMFGVLTGHFAKSTAFIAALLLTAYESGVLTHMLFRRYFIRTRMHMQESNPILLSSRPHVSIIQMILRPLLGRVNTATLAITRKDLTYQFRDVRNLNQLILLFSLVAVYLFSISALPLNWESIYNLQLKYIISFMNIALILFIIVALCSRIVYTAIISETASIWLSRISPVTSSRFIWTKLIFYGLPLTFLTSVLVLFSFHFIHIDKVLIYVLFIVTVLSTFALTALALSFGISDISSHLLDPAKEVTGSESVLYLSVSFLLIVLILALLVIPVYYYFKREAGHAYFVGKTWIIMGMVIGGIIITNIVIAITSIRRSKKKYSSIELL